MDGEPDVFDWVECFSVGSSFFTATGTAVLLDGKNYRVSAFEDDDDLEDGFTITGSIVGNENRLSYGLFSFFNTGTFKATGKRTDVILGDNGCPV